MPWEIVEPLDHLAVGERWDAVATRRFPGVHGEVTEVLFERDGQIASARFSAAGPAFLDAPPAGVSPDAADRVAAALRRRASIPLTADALAPSRATPDAPPPTEAP